MKEKLSIDPHLVECYYLDSCSQNDAFKVEQWLMMADKSEDDRKLLDDIFERIDNKDEALADRAYEKCAEKLNLEGITAGRTTTRTWIPIVAALAVAASFVLGVFLNFNEEESQTKVDFFEAYAGRGRTEKVTLPDGSDIILKSGSSLIYPSKFTGTTREVFLSGECYASIAKNPECPFVMTVGKMSVRVTGTEFNIKSFPEDTEMEVALVKGSISLEERSEDGSPVQTISLAPGNVIKVDKTNGETRIAEFNVDSYSATEENNGAFVFLDRRFCDIVSELSRRLDVNIVLSDSTLADRRFYSSFVNGESLDQMLAVFNADGSMNVTSEAGIIRICRKNSL